MLILFCWMGIHSVSAQTREPQMQDKRVPATHHVLKGKKVKRVPDAVQMSFSNTFPGAQSARWFKKENLYRVQFVEHGQTLIAVYNENGERMD